MKRHRLPNMKRCRGSSLLVALMFLIIVAMIGVSVGNVGVLEEKMAGGTRDRDLALQAAEAAMRDAELRLATTAFRANTFPLWVTSVSPNSNSATFWETCFAGSASPCQSANRYSPVNALPTTGTDRIAAPPVFIVEEKPISGSNRIFRVTTRANGGSADAVVILQAEFATPNP